MSSFFTFPYCSYNIPRALRMQIHKFLACIRVKFRSGIHPFPPYYYYGAYYVFNAHLFIFIAFSAFFFVFGFSNVFHFLLLLFLWCMLCIQSDSPLHIHSCVWMIHELHLGKQTVSLFLALPLFCSPSLSVPMLVPSLSFAPCSVAQKVQFTAPPRRPRHRIWGNFGKL